MSTEVNSNMESSSVDRDVLIIGAGPSGAVAAALLVNRGYDVLVLEKEVFPRFSIGESLLPQCMEFIEEAGMLDAIKAGNFQFKDGAAFHHAGKRCHFLFTEKFSPGWGTTFQVQRAKFDKILADEAARMGAEVRYQHTITDVDFDGEHPLVSYIDANGQSSQITARFVLDASGFGRVLPRLLDLHQPSDFPVRESLFTHIEDNITDPTHDRDKILINVHPTQRDIWYWLIPFADGRCSLGVVAKPEYLAAMPGDNAAKLKQLVADDPWLPTLLGGARYDTPVRNITGYAANVSHMHGNGFALLGNAAEFLDPVFSSGVTIAMKSASMAASLLHRQFQGENVDWESEFAEPLKFGVDTFRTFVTGWYDQRFQHVIFHDAAEFAKVKNMISSILAGYAWDKKNPYVSDSERRLNVLAKICAAN